MDVRSLFVTMLWILDKDFRAKVFASHSEVLDVIQIATTKGELSNFREMAVINPRQRASAAQMLVKWHGGDGLSTPRNLVPDLASGAPPDIAAAKTPAWGHLALPPHLQLSGLQVDEEMSYS